jgi:hypothetical protein
MEQENNIFLKKEVLRETFLLTGKIDNLNLIENLKKEISEKLKLL